MSTGRFADNVMRKIDELTDATTRAAAHGVATIVVDLLDRGVLDAEVVASAMLGAPDNPLVAVEAAIAEAEKVAL